MIIIGAKGRLNIERALKELKGMGKFAQVLDARVVCGKEHLRIAYEHAKRAFKNGRNVCKNIEMEFMLYASAKRQIKDAIEFIGAKEEGIYAFVFDGISEEEAMDFVKKLNLKIDNNVLEPTMEKLKKFVEEKELETVDKAFYFDLLFEKMALLNAIK